MAREKKIALVRCSGGERAVRRDGAEISGMNCQQALEAYPEGLLVCPQGCLGLGSCVSACRLKAIHIGSHGAALVDHEKCKGCGLCVKACPRNLIELVPADTLIAPRCSNQQVGKDARTACRVSCIACGICVKNCPVNAITIQNNHAVIDYKKCISCGMCAVKCPKGVIVDSGGIFTPVDP